MAAYNAILIGTDYIGGSDSVKVTESNGAGTLNQLLATVGNEKYIIDSFEIWSDSPDQLMQPIGLANFPPNGNSSNRYLIPQKSRYQFQDVLKGLDTNNFPLDENTRITYNIFPNANVRLTMNINKSIRKDNSLVKGLEEAGAKNINYDILKDIGISEPEEIIEKTKQEKQTIGESQFKNSIGKILQPQNGKIEYKAAKLIVAGLVIVAGVFALFAASNGAAPSFLYNEN
jgi:hypothetical protein